MQACKLQPTMETKQLMIRIEESFGGPVAAARAVGVDFSTWYRWREGAYDVPSPMRKLLGLLAERQKLGDDNG